jgi:two-component system, chemotaxis family, CheB/CheR fusion protein
MTNFSVVGIGASAGGVEATVQLMRELPPDTGMAFVVVQHLSPSHPSMLPEILGRSTAMVVTQVDDEPQVEPNRVYVIPPGRSMTIRKGKLALLPRPDGLPHHPVDQFLTALAEDRGTLSIGVVLSGTGTDGTAGLQAIKAEGGITFAQDDTAQQEGMPRNAVAAGAVDFVMPPADIAREIARIARHPYIALEGGDSPEPAAQRPDPTQLERVLALLRQATGADFSAYKLNTLVRRINRRMVLQRLDKLEQYVEQLQRDAQELDALYQDILISVTTFFRNPGAFEALKTRVLPRLLTERGRQDPLRIWSIGCSTGEEAYSLAMIVVELLSDRGNPVPVQIYGTDLNESAIERARLGFYAKSVVHDVSPERLRRFFHEADGGYRISKAIRDMCVFARQNVLSDPPFSRMDLVACRNVLIYIEQSLQRKLVPMLHYALKPNGFLFLGSSETIGSYGDLFEPEDAKHKIFSKKPVAARAEAAIIGAGRSTAQAYLERRGERVHEAAGDPVAEVHREADRLLLSRYAPAGVLVNGDLEVLQFRGDTGWYLAPAPGKASLNVLKMAREGLMVSLRAALHRARKEGAAVQEKRVRVRSNGGYREIDLSVIPVNAPAPAGACYLVLFEDAAAVHVPVPLSKELAPDAEASDRQIQRLTQELAATREYLQSVIEQQEAVNEELQSANEEVQSANEELQSINEELETSKEEIQSSNEELTTVNEELQHRNEELSRVNNDVNNLLASVQTAIVMVWHDLRIRRFTPMAQTLLNLIAADVDRPLGDIKLNVEGADIAELAREAIDTASVREVDVRDRDGRWHSLRIRPYRTTENKIEGAVIMLVDVHALKQSQEVLAWQARILEQTHEPIIVQRPGGEIVYWNQGAEQTYGYSRDEALGRSSRELLGTRADAGLQHVDEAVQREGRWSGELVQRTKDGRTIVVDSIISSIHEQDERLLIQTGRDVTPRKELEEDLRKRVRELAAADEQKDQFVAMLAHELRNPLAPMRNALEIMKAKDAGGDAEAVRIRDMLDRQVTKMSRIVTDLLEAAKLTRSQVELRRAPLALQSVIERSVELLKPAMQARMQTLELSMPAAALMVSADETRLEQVFANLLENAVKFTREGGRIEVRAAVEREQPDGRQEAVVMVKDNGVGIAPQVLPSIFDIFVQAEQPLDRPSGGLGIGLSLVRSLVERHGGCVSAHSEGVGRGAEFVVRLPLLERASIQQSPPRARPVAPDGRNRILLVDDNDDFANSMAALLQLSGYVVETAHSGREALELLPALRPAAVLLDIGLPDVNGYDIARSIRSMPGMQDALLLALTGYGEYSDRARSSHAGFDHHLVKPVSVDSVLALLAGESQAV